MTRLHNILLFSLFCALLSQITAINEISCNNEDNLPEYLPQQVHLSLGYDEREMIVMWHTEVSTPVSAVKYFWGPCSNSPDYRTWNVVFGSNKGYTGYNGTVHTASLQNLILDSKYCYSVGDPCRGTLHITTTRFGC